ncbi:hypothetical protein chiPu_0004221 [Chiloscyllium punctatum]|uniref:Uncharacterized protein n=1 Tax=Chiloscyllium punctatum TaxID=137246 RepID=A0A401S5Z6_CHIPU|nr:hypothetical protein [Chiloscyllium punctatum]
MAPVGTRRVLAPVGTWPGGALVHIRATAPVPGQGVAGIACALEPSRARDAQLLAGVAQAGIQGLARAEVVRERVTVAAAARGAPAQTIEADLGAAAIACLAGGERRAEPGLGWRPAVRAGAGLLAQGVAVRPRALARHRRQRPEGHQGQGGALGVERSGVGDRAGPGQLDWPAHASEAELAEVAVDPVVAAHAVRPGEANPRGPGTGRGGGGEVDAAVRGACAEGLPGPVGVGALLSPRGPEEAPQRLVLLVAVPAGQLEPQPQPAAGARRPGEARLQQAVDVPRLPFVLDRRQVPAVGLAAVQRPPEGLGDHVRRVAGVAGAVGRVRGRCGPVTPQGAQQELVQQQQQHLPSAWQQSVPQT